MTKQAFTVRYALDLLDAADGVLSKLPPESDLVEALRALALELEARAREDDGEQPSIARSSTRSPAREISLPEELIDQVLHSKGEQVRELLDHSEALQTKAALAELATQMGVTFSRNQKKIALKETIVAHAQSRSMLADFGAHDSDSALPSRTRGPRASKATVDAAGDFEASACEDVEVDEPDPEVPEPRSDEQGDG